MVVYADELLALNGVVNYLLLLACARLGGAEISWLRLALAATLGAAYALCAMLPSWGFLPSAGMKGAVCMGMVLIAFGKERRLLHLTGLFLGLSLAYAGLVLLAATLLGAQAVVRNGVVCYPVSYRAMVLTAGLTYAATATVLRHSFAHRAATVTTAELKLEDRTVRAPTLLDTGSELRDPMTNSCVLLVDWELARQLLPQTVRDAVTEASAARPAELLAELAQAEPTLRMQLLPYKALGGGGLLLALRCDSITCGGKAAGRWAAISPTTLAGDGRYRALTGCGA